MKRLLTIILTGAAIVAASPADSTGKFIPFQPKDITEITALLQQHLDSCTHRANIDVEKARQAAEEYQKLLVGKTPEEIKAAFEAKRAEAKLELQNAIAKLDSASVVVKAQVEDATAKIQARLQEKAEELKAIQARIEAHRADVLANKPVTPPTTK